LGTLLFCQSAWLALGRLFRRPSLPPRDSFRIAGILDPILNLPRSDISDQLPELDRVAGAFETTGFHAGNMAWRAPIGTQRQAAPEAVAIQTDPLPTAENCR
jgi:hypothetical protein